MSFIVVTRVRPPLERDFTDRICGDTINLHFFSTLYNIFMKIKPQYIALVGILFV